MDNTITGYGKDSTPSERCCEECGSYVTKQFIRVFGSNDGKIYGCLNCLTGSEVRNGKCRRQ